MNIDWKNYERSNICATKKGDKVEVGPSSLNNENQVTVYRNGNPIHHFGDAERAKHFVEACLVHSNS